MMSFCFLPRSIDDGSSHTILSHGPCLHLGCATTTIGARRTPVFAPAGVFAPKPPEVGRNSNALPPVAVTYGGCSGRLVGRAPRLQTSCKRIGLPPQTSCKHPTAETPRNRAKRPTPIRQTFGTFRPCSPAFADNSLYRGARIRTGDLTDPNRRSVHAIRHENSCKCVGF
jgi:hypothetical protein